MSTKPANDKDYFVPIDNGQIADTILHLEAEIERLHSELLGIKRDIDELKTKQGLVTKPSRSFLRQHADRKIGTKRKMIRLLFLLLPFIGLIIGFWIYVSLTG